jgi:hypothetical protein
MLGADGNDILYGNEGADLVQGGAGTDLIYGGGGADTLYGDADGLSAQPGTGYDDLIESGAGDDRAFGGLGNDEIQGEGGNDTIAGGKDDGRLTFADAAHPNAKAPTEVVIGDNLYGNDGSDLFRYAKGDGVDLLWDFDAAQDVLEVTGYRLADIAVTFVGAVTDAGRSNGHALDAGSHQKLAIILDTAGDAIVFNDLTGRDSAHKAYRFDDGTYTAAELLARAMPATQAAAPAAPAPAASVSAALHVTNSWWGGFQGEITVTANKAVDAWDIGLGSKYQIANVWNAKLAGSAAQSGGTLYHLDDAGWNGHLAAGQSVTIGFTGNTGIAGVVDAAKLQGDLWLG